MTSKHPSQKQSITTWALLLGLSLSACLSNNGPEGFNITQATTLLALDTGKIWQRVSRRIDGDLVELDDCQLNNYYSFDIVNDSDTLLYIGGTTACDQMNADTLQRWGWRVLGNVREEFTDSLELTDENGIVTYRIIREINANNLEWEYSENNQDILETLFWNRDFEE